MLARRYMEFLRSMLESTGDEVVVKAAEKFVALCENGNFNPLTVPDSMRQSAVIDWKGMTKVAPTASGVGGPDVAPGMANQVVNGRCTRDQGEETRNSEWDLPDFAKVSQSKNMPLDKLIANGKKNSPKVMMMGAPFEQMPMRCGYTITTPLNYQGTDVGYAGGNGGASAAGGA